MNITVNGQQHSIENESSLEGIIRGLVKDCARVIAEHNGAIVKKDNWAATPVRDGDKIELVSFVGGG